MAFIGTWVICCVVVFIAIWIFGLLNNLLAIIIGVALILAVLITVLFERSNQIEELEKRIATLEQNSTNNASDKTDVES